MQQDNRAEARASLLSLFQQKPPQSSSPEQGEDSQPFPPQQQQQQQDQLQPQQQQPTEVVSQPTQQPAEQQLNKDIEALFRNLASPTSSAIQPETPAPMPLQQVSPNTYPENIQNSPSTNAERQNALLSLLGSVGGAPPPSTISPTAAPPRQLSTSTTMSGSESQGKALLESIMAGSQMTSPLPTQAPPAASPPTIRQTQLEAEPPRRSQFDYVSPYEAFMAPEPPLPIPANVTQSQPHAAPSPARKKPVPAYNPSPAPATPVESSGDQGSPQVHQMSPPTAANRSPEISHNLMQTVQQPLSDNEPFHDSGAKGNNRPLMSFDSASESGRDNGRGQGSQSGMSGLGPQGPLPPIPPNAQQQQQQQQIPPQARVSPVPNQRQTQMPMQQQHSSPPTRPAHPPPNRASPPMGPSHPQQAQYQQQAPRGRGSPASIISRDGQTKPSPTGGRDSPGAAKRNSGSKMTIQSQQQQYVQQQQQQQREQQQREQQQREQQQRDREREQQAKEKRAQGPTTSVFTIDVNAALHSTLAPDGIAQVTPIALLKLEPTYLPGTTIGVANFIAYSMTRGRVRLIGRETGARALIRLPETFPTHSSVQDMAISGTRLACVTNDGGLVVWDVPGDIEDDIQSRIILHVLPALDSSRFKVVKWHPKQPNTLAVASEREIYLLQVDDAHAVFGAEGVRQDELSRISKVFSIPSPLVSFTFDVPQIALASISIDSTITLWSIKDKLPFWTGRVGGEGYPSSIDFLEGGLVVGRNQGNVLQLLPIMSTTVLSTVQFSQGPGGPPEEPLMFGHLSYDSTLKTLWVANSARSSLFAIKVGTESVNAPPPQHMAMEPTPPTIRPSFEQIIEFPCQNSTINLTLVAAEGGEPGNTWIRDPSLAVCAFSVHAGGVDQINIERDAFENALASVPSKLPNAMYYPLPMEKRRSEGQILNPPPMQQPQQQQQQAQQQQLQQPQMMQQPLSGPPQQTTSMFQQQPSYSQANPIYAAQAATHHASSSAPPSNNNRMRTPPSDLDRLVAAAASAGPYDPGLIQAQSQQAQQQQQLVQQQLVQQQQSPLGNPPIQNLGNAGKGKQKETNLGAPKNFGANRGNGGGPDTTAVTAAALAASTAAAAAAARAEAVKDTENITKEIKKVEESLHNRIGRLIVKELDKQQSRLEDARRADQTADFERQETILKLISTELTKNTTRVVETAVKAVVQNSVLPALESVTKNEVKAALNGQIAKGLAESMKQTLPTEVEKLLLRPDVSNHVARTFSQAITPLVERNVRDSIKNTLIPAYAQASNTMHQELAREIHAEMMTLKKEVVAWQSEALKGTESTLREMEQSVRSLADQVKALSVQITTQQRESRSTPLGRQSHNEPSLSSEYGISPYRPPPQSAQQNTFPSMQPQTYQAPQSSWIAPPLAPQPMQPSAPPSLPSGIQHPLPQQAPPPAPSQPPAPKAKKDDWDELFLTNLGYQDAKELRDLLARCNPDVIMPGNGQAAPLSQAVILTLIHRLALSLTELSPADEPFKSSLWWLQRASHTLRPMDNVIAPYVSRVLQTALASLNTTSSRLNVIPGGASPEVNTVIGQIQQSLNNMI